MLIFAPLLLNLYDFVVALLTQSQALGYFFQSSRVALLENSLLLSLSASLLSALVGGALALLFFALPKGLKALYALLLFLLFAIEPIIYLGAFQQTALFGVLTPFGKTLLTITPSMMALCGLLFIFGLSFVNQESLRVASMMASKRDVFRFIVKPQLLFMLLGAFLMVFVLLFSHSEVSSILGYRTYSEEFLAQITLVESLDKTAILSLPFYLLALSFLLVLWAILRRYPMKFKIKEQIAPRSFVALDKRVVLALFGLVVALFLTLLILLLSKIAFDELALLISENSSVLLDSLLLALVVSGLTVALSLFVYRSIEQFSVLTLLLFLTLLTPSELIGLEVIKIKQFFDLNSELMEYLFFIFSSGIKLLPLGVGLVAILYHREVNDESLLFLPISKIDTFFKIILPTYGLRWMFMVMVIAIFALNQLSISVLLIPIGFDVMIIKIYNLLHYGDYSAVTFLSLMQIVLMLVIAGVLQRIRR